MRVLKQMSKRRMIRQLVSKMEIVLSKLQQEGSADFFAKNVMIPAMFILGIISFVILCNLGMNLCL